MNNVPHWWNWELELSPHVLKRMVDRGFSEVGLRLVMAKATDVESNDETGRWVVRTTHESRPWNVIVEPDWMDRSSEVIAAYPVNDT